MGVEEGGRVEKNRAGGGSFIPIVDDRVFIQDFLVGVKKMEPCLLVCVCVCVCVCSPRKFLKLTCS